MITKILSIKNIPLLLKKTLQIGRHTSGLHLPIILRKKKQKAIEAFKTVLSLKPNHVWSMGFIALIYGEQKNYKECIKWCKRGLKLNNDATAIHFLIGKAYYEQGNYFGFR